MRNRTLLLVAVLILGAVGGPAAGIAAAEDVTMTVSVVTAAGDPVSDAEVTVDWTLDSETGTVVETTRSNGKTLVDIPEGADATLEIDHPGFVRNEPFELTDASAREVEVTVYQRSSLDLAVVDEDGPVEGVRAVLRKGGAVVEVLSTDGRGEAAAEDIEAGEYTVNLFEPGYFRQVVALTVQGSTSEDIRIERGSVSVRFLVVDGNFDPAKPVSEASISGPDFTIQTGADGQRTFGLPVNTDLTVTVEKDGFDTVERSIAVREQDMEVEITTRKLDVVNVAVPNERVVVGESLQVTVTDQYGDPLPDATVYLNGEAVGEPDSQGVLRVPVESRGEHALSAEYEQLSSDRLTITGVESAADLDGTGAPDPEANGDSGERPSGFLGIPALGLLHLRSVAIGAAGGLLLAAMLFLYVRVA